MAVKYDPEVNILEHDDTSAPQTKRVLNYGWDASGTQKVRQAVDSDGHAQVDILSGAGGTQYTEGDTDASITGTAAMMEGGSNTLLPLQGTVADGLLVNLGSNNDVTVTGSVTANAGTNLNTSALALETTATSIKTAVETIDNAISGSEMQVDVVTLPDVTAVGKVADGAAVSGNPVRVAGSDGTTTRSILTDNSGKILLGAASNAIGKLAANSGVDIGDVDVTSAVITGGGVAHDGVATSVNPLLVGGYASAAAPTSVSNDGDSTRLWTLRNGSPVVNLASGGTLIPVVDATADNLTPTVALPSGSFTYGYEGANWDKISSWYFNADSQTERTGLAVTNANHVFNGTTWDRMRGDSQGIKVAGSVAHDAAVAGNPIRVGAYASTTNRTRVGSGDQVDILADLAGRQITNLGQVRELRGKQTTTISASTAETTIVTAGGSGVFNDLVAVVISNTSATAARVDIRDDTAGTILFSLYIPAGDMRGFSLPGSSIPQTASNKNWTAQSSASITDLRVLAIFEKNT